MKYNFCIVLLSESEYLGLIKSNDWLQLSILISVFVTSTTIHILILRNLTPDTPYQRECKKSFLELTCQIQNILIKPINITTIGSKQIMNN